MPSTEVLLVAHVFVRNNENIEGTIGGAEQIPVQNPFPASTLHGGNPMAGEEPLQWMRDIFVEKDLHAGSRSNSWEASASQRSTEGKNPRNCSMEKPSER